MPRLLNICCFSEPIPRKGTETLQYSIDVALFLLWFFRTYSPQGDGNFSNFLSNKINMINVFQNLFPARGRKPIGVHIMQATNNHQQFFRTYSPQGDGNTSHCLSSHLVMAIVFQNLFPARGRKLG